MKTTVTTISLILSVAIIIAAAIGIVIIRKKIRREHWILAPFSIFFVFFFCAAVIAIFPIYYVDYLAGVSSIPKFFQAIVLSAQNALALITLNGNFDNIHEFVSFGIGNVGRVYSLYMTVIIIALPLMTAGYILSLFGEIVYAIRYKVVGGDVIFSALNEKSLCLAEDIRRVSNKKHIVFTNVHEGSEFIGQAKRINAVCFKKGICSLKFQRRKLCKVYLLEEDETENLRQALELVEKYKDRKMELYVLSHSAESEVLLGSVCANIKVRQIDESMNLSYMLMDRSLFDNATICDNKKIITAVILGLGRNGIDILKTLCWLCQMPGYELKVHVFDNRDVVDEISQIMPEIISGNCSSDPLDAQYTIAFHKVDVNGKRFTDELSSISPTVAYVSLGDDELNIKTAITVRSILCRTELLPTIYAMVYDSVVSQAVRDGLSDFSGNSYNITFVDATKSLYSVKGLDRSELESEALKVHIQWAETDRQKDEAAKLFYRSEYYRRSSIAQVIYKQIREQLGINVEDAETLRIYEHRRWAAFMRTEGFIFSEKRDQIAKTHPMLVPYDKLSDGEKIKDN